MNAYKNRIKKLINFGLSPILIVTILFLGYGQFSFDRKASRKHVSSQTRQCSLNVSESLKSNNIQIERSCIQAMIILLKGEKGTSLASKFIQEQINDLFAGHRVNTYKKVRSCTHFIFAHRDNKAEQQSKAPVFTPLIC